MVAASAIVATPASGQSAAADRLISAQININGMARDYLLFIPASFAAKGSEHALAIAFHGLGSNELSLVRFVAPAASAHGVVVAFPQGFDDSWNADSCCGGARFLHLDDLGFATALIAQLSDRFHPSSVVAAGYSNGAMLAWNLACRHTGLINALVDASGTEAVTEADCQPTSPLKVVAVHGRDDPKVPYDGGGDVADMGIDNSATPFRAITDVMREWGLDHDGCAAMSTTPHSGWSTTHWTSCANGTSATLVTVDGMGHDVPNHGGGEPVDFGDLIATAARRG